ncbi:MAG: helix-turn-helix domain-containing protein, partial [Chloroflexi bacterium]|nr:helix-turn-helix domain-containing protein [Chloroflexota bacterium]
MGRRYAHLTIEDRCDLARRHTAGASIRQIAAALDRAPSTIARELKRNASRTQGYQPRYADQQAHARRWRGPRPAPDP